MSWSDKADWDRGEFEREARELICQNYPCQHPFCPECGPEIDVWEGFDDCST
jgi:hypothetical protein